MNKKKRYIILNSSDSSTTTLQTINDLITALSEGERTTFSHIIQSVKFNPTDFEKFASWSSDCYTRNCIVNNDKYELILLCWEAGQQTPIHDHGGEECWVKIIEGEFKETIYQENKVGELKAIRSSFAKPNDVTYMKDFMGFHALENVSNKKSMSLHLYAKPIRNCRSFDEKSGNFVSKDLTYDTTHNQ